MEADVVEAETIEKPHPPKKSNTWIWIIVAAGVFFVLLIALLPAALMVWSRFAGAKIKATQNQISEFKTPLSVYVMDIGSVPTNNQGLDALRIAPADLTDPSKWYGPYLSRDIPQDPWSNPYHYERLAPKEYRIRSGGPDGQPGTADDIMEEIRSRF